MKKQIYEIIGYDPIFKPDLASVHDLESIALLDGNIQRDIISGTSPSEAIEKFDKKHSTDGHLYECVICNVIS